jgi:succinate-acetate transporter protein
MLLWSTRVTVAVFMVFLTLELTEIVLSVGFFSSSGGVANDIVKVGGYVGIVTAIVAWYASAAGVVNGMAGRQILKVGRPIWKERPAAPVLGPELAAPVQPGVRQRVP